MNNEERNILIPHETFVQALLYLQTLAEMKYKIHLDLTKRKPEMPREKYETLFVNSANEIFQLNALIQDGFDRLDKERERE